MTQRLMSEGRILHPQKLHSEVTSTYIKIETGLMINLNTKTPEEGNDYYRIEKDSTPIIGINGSMQNISS